MNKPIEVSTMSIIMGALSNATEEMGANLLRTARSTIIREARDMSCALLDIDAQIISEAEHVPVQMSSLGLPLRACLAKHPVGELEPGDAFITNDPFAGGQHLQDIVIFSPIFIDGKVFAFAGSIAHHIDIGGGSAGMTVDAKDMYQEGLRFAAVRVQAERDFEAGGVIHDIVYGNFREPATTMGDLRAQLAANRTGTLRLTSTVAKFGRESVRRAFAGILDYSERLTRAAIRDVPNGIFESTDQIDRGVLSEAPIRVRLKLTVDGDSIKLDFEGSDSQVSDFLNVPWGSTVSTCRSAVKMLLESGRQRIPANEGCYRPIEVVAPYGCVVNPAPPAAVRARMCGAYRIFDTIVLAFQQAIPERCPALGFHVNTTVGFVTQTKGRYRIFIEDLGGGWGGSPACDGADMLDTPLSNCKITPVEALEADHPYLLVRRYELIPDSGGLGQFRGGMGSAREYEVLGDGVTFFAYGDRHKTPPKGAAGGGPGTCGVFRKYSAGVTEVLPDKVSCAAAIGDRFEVVVGGGGGYGEPSSRSVAAVARDVRLGKVSEARTGHVPAGETEVVEL